MFRVVVQSERIDIAAETANLSSDGAAGAAVVFCGYCRDEGGRLSALELEHYPGMAEREIQNILAEAAARWPLISACVVHRFGKIAPGEEIVFSGCTSVHRHAAFEAGAYVMDFMKTRAPFWKREHLLDGTVGAWVDAKDADLSATDRWHRL
ncbi:molybdenum cofactor biosynthesis protein MoaE [Aureimonas fodinaquatilis]|uniref:Molybdopterin synthase catalytic subunit n=2 Tax=Aureimonas fodinaquatilis TaxID=2565783 RepID=A0A5B0DUV7_9HYPH|nr:molybdenum cofactor biosynthesis protein MoaE [Aureimonas fodinaquatilis]